jgi:prepilin-type N-terminal cleavage/methylation domain-containing protein
MPCERRPGWTLIELLIVVVMVGIVASLALPNYSRMKEATYDKEAIASLKLVAAAEKVYRLERGYFSEATSTQAVNENLKLSLPTGNDKKWDYTITGASTISFTSTAQRGSSIWKIDQSSEEPYKQ